MEFDKEKKARFMNLCKFFLEIKYLHVIGSSQNFLDISFLTHSKTKKNYRIANLYELPMSKHKNGDIFQRKKMAK